MFSLPQVQGWHGIAALARVGETIAKGRQAEQIRQAEPRPRRAAFKGDVHMAHGAVFTPTATHRGGQAAMRTLICNRVYGSMWWIPGWTQP